MPKGSRKARSPTPATTAQTEYDPRQRRKVLRTDSKIASVVSGDAGFAPTPDVRRASSSANTLRITSTSQLLPTWRRQRSLSSFFRPLKFVRFPLWAIAMPNGLLTVKGCASSTSPPPIVG